MCSSDLTLAIACGSMVVSHVNDAYFWVISQMSGVSVTQEIARHTDPRLTQAVYVDANLLPLRDAINALAAAGYGESGEIGVDRPPSADRLMESRQAMENANHNPSGPKGARCRRARSASPCWSRCTSSTAARRSSPSRTTRPGRRAWRPSLGWPTRSAWAPPW